MPQTKPSLKQAVDQSMSEYRRPFGRCKECGQPTAPSTGFCPNCIEISDRPSGGHSEYDEITHVSKSPNTPPSIPNESKTKAKR